MREYAVYKGESLTFIGTLEECAKHLGVMPKTVEFYTTPTYQRRIENRRNPQKCTIVIKLDND